MHMQRIFFVRILLYNTKYKNTANKTNNTLHLQMRAFQNADFNMEVRKLQLFSSNTTTKSEIKVEGKVI